MVADEHELARAARGVQEDERIVFGVRGRLVAHQEVEVPVAADVVVVCAAESQRRGVAVQVEYLKGIFVTSCNSLIELFETDLKLSV